MGRKINNKMVSWLLAMIVVFAVGIALPARASYIPFNTNVKMNVGVGTSSPGSNLSVLGGESLGAYATNAAPSGGIIASGNVGIGSAAPGQILDVNGTVRAIQFVGDGSQLTGVSGSGWTLGASNVGISTTNNVGIGTDSPEALLHVKSAGGANSGIRLENTNAGSYATIDFYTPSGLGGQFVSTGATFTNGLIGGDQTVLANELTNGALQLGALGSNGYVTLFSGGLTASNERMRITPAGNIGVGTTTPEGGLVVMNGNVGIGTWVPYYTLDVEGGANPGIVTTAAGIGDSSISDSTVGIKVVPSGIRSSTLGNYFNGISFNHLFKSNGFQSNNMAWIGERLVSTAGNETGALVFATKATTGSSQPTEYMALMPGGNVGVGSISPGQLLDVQGTVRAIQFVGDGSQLTGISGSGWTLGASNVGISTTNNVGIGTSLTTTAGLTVMNGNVGIGTWVPSQEFQVGDESSYTKIDSTGHLTGNAQMIMSSQITATNFQTANGSTSSIGLNLNAPSGVTVDLLKVVTNSGAAQFGIDKNGNVGIGTDILGQTLGIAGNVGIGTVANSSFITSAPDAKGLVIEGNVGIGTTKNSTAGLTVMNGNVGIGTWVPGALFQVGGPGNVGIGSTAPGEPLDVNGKVRMTGFNLSTSPNNGYVLTSDGNGNGTWQAAVAGSNYWLLTAGAGNVGISTTNTVGIGTTSGVGAGLVVMNGNVGIGTWVPAASLDLTGTISMTPSGTANVTAGGGITVTRAIMRVVGNGGAVTVTANPAIASGSDGEEAVILGTSNVNTVTLTNGNGLQLASGVSFTLNQGSNMRLIYDAVNAKWVEVSRSAN